MRRQGHPGFESITSTPEIRKEKKRVDNSDRVPSLFKKVLVDLCTDTNYKKCGDEKETKKRLSWFQVISLSNIFDRLPSVVSEIDLNMIITDGELVRSPMVLYLAGVVNQFMKLFPCLFRFHWVFVFAVRTTDFVCGARLVKASMRGVFFALLVIVLSRN